MTGRQAEQTWEILNSGNYFSFRKNLLFWRGSQRTKRVRPTGKAFDYILTGDHASEYETLGMRNKIEEQDFRSVHGKMVQVWGNHVRHWTKVSLTVAYFNYNPGISPSCVNWRDRERRYKTEPSQIHLRNRETFLFHQRYEAHCKESFQV